VADLSKLKRIVDIEYNDIFMDFVRKMLK